MSSDIKISNAIYNFKKFTLCRMFHKLCLDHLIGNHHQYKCLCLIKFSIIYISPIKNPSGFVRSGKPRRTNKHVIKSAIFHALCCNCI